MRGKEGREGLQRLFLLVQYVQCVLQVQCHHNVNVTDEACKTEITDYA